MSVAARLLLVLVATAACAARTPAPRPPIKMAITIDDLPFVGQVGPGDSRLAATQRLLGAFAARRVPAVGFVNCARAEADPAVIEAWRTGGFELANHAHTHMGLNDADVATWLEDVRRCHELLTRTSPAGRPARYFRYPYLHHGPTADKRDAAAAGVRALGYQTAHVSVDNVDYMIAKSYGHAAARSNEAEKRRIGALYVEYMLAALAHAEELAHAAAGRPIAHVMLLHANLLAADHFASVLDAFAARGVTFVSLAEALADPVYAREDRYVGRRGVAWPYHVQPDLLATYGPREDQQQAALQQALRAR